MEKLEETKSLSTIEKKFIADNIGPNLQRLGRGLELTLTQLTELNDGRGSLLDKANLLIEWWEQTNGENATKHCMIKELNNIGRKDIADQLKKATLETNKINSTDFTKLQRNLIKMYSEISIPQPPGVDRDLPIDQVFIEQEMKRYHDPSNTSKSVKVNDLFTTACGEPANRILVEGDPGFGKTTLTTKLVNDWAKGKEYISSRFGLVLLIPLREIGDQKLEDAIPRMIENISGKIKLVKQNVQKFLEDNEVLLILDGYDEMCLEGKEFLKPILLMNELESTCILLTSRRGLFTVRESVKHSSVVTFQQQHSDNQFKFWDSRVLLDGLSDDQVKAVLEAHFEIDWETKEEQINALFSGDRQQIFRCPLLAFWLGLILENNQIEANQTRTSFFKALMNLIFHKTQVRENLIDESDSFDIFSENSLTIPLKLELYQFGKFAVQRLIKRNFLFTEHDLKFLSNSVILKSDVLMKYKMITRYNEIVYYQPVHRTFVEFIAAFGVCNDLIEGSNNSNEIITQLMKQHLVPSEDSLFYLFLAGLLDQNADCLFQSLSPWSAIFHVNQAVMAHILMELTNVTEKVIESLLCFVPSWFAINDSHLYNNYISSECFQKLFRAATENKIISVLIIQLQGLPKLPLETINLPKLILFSRVDYDSSVAWPSFHCDELVCIFSRSKYSENWDYLKYFFCIEADKYHLHVFDSSSSFCTVLLDSINQRKWNGQSFETVQFCQCDLEDSHLATLSELVKKELITKIVSLDLAEICKVLATPDAISRLWDDVVRSASIDEFGYRNFSWQDIIPVFDFKMVENNKKSFNKLLFSGLYHPLISSESKDNRIIVKKLIDESVNVIEKCDKRFLVAQSFNNLTTLSCSFDILRIDSLAGFDFTFLQELFLIIGDNELDDWKNIPAFSVEDKMPVLKTLDIDFARIREIPSTVENVLLSFMNLKTLRSLRFLSIRNHSDLFTSMLDLVSKVELKSNCVRALEIRNHGEGSFSFIQLDSLKNALKQNHVNCLYFFVPDSCTSDLISSFSEQEFLFISNLQPEPAIRKNAHFTIFENSDISLQLSASYGPTECQIRLKN